MEALFIYKHCDWHTLFKNIAINKGITSKMASNE